MRQPHRQLHRPRAGGVPPVGPPAQHEPQRLPGAAHRGAPPTGPPTPGLGLRVARDVSVDSRHAWLRGRGIIGMSGSSLKQQAAHLRTPSCRAARAQWSQPFLKLCRMHCFAVLQDMTGGKPTEGSAPEQPGALNAAAGAESGGGWRSSSVSWPLAHSGRSGA